MCVRAAHKTAPRHAGQRNVVNIAALAPHETEILTSAKGAADIWRVGFLFTGGHQALTQPKIGCAASPGEHAASLRQK
jgi:hypothetical protein